MWARLKEATILLYRIWSLWKRKEVGALKIMWWLYGLLTQADEKGAGTMKEEEFRKKLAENGKMFVQVIRTDRVKSKSPNYDDGEMVSTNDGAAMVAVPKYEWHTQQSVVAFYVSDTKGPAISKANARLRSVKVAPYIADDGKVYPQFEIRRGLVE